MAGSFIEGQSKVLSGTYTLMKAAVQAASLGARGIVSYPFTADWGPVNVLTSVKFDTEFRKQFNATGATGTVNKIYKHAFNGSPQTVLAYRLATATAAKGTVTLYSSGTVVSLTLETLYPSARAFTAVVKAGLVADTKTVQITEGGVVLVEVTDSTVAGLVSQLNASDYVRVTAQGAIIPQDTAGVNFTGGNNGAVVTTTEYQAYLDELEADATANAFAYDGVTDDSILAVAEAWSKRVNDAGVRTAFVRGGASAWDTDGGTAANAKSKALNTRYVVNVGNGVDGFTSADMAIYAAARVAAVGLNQTLTDEPTTGYVKVNKKLTPSQREASKLAGTLVFVQKDGVVRIDEGVNTLTVPSGNDVKEMGKIRISNALNAIASDLERFGDEYKRTRSNTQEARVTFAANVEETYLKGLASQQVISADYSYQEDPEWHGKNAVYTPKIDEAYFASGIRVVDSMEKVYQKFSLNF